MASHSTRLNQSKSQTNRLRRQKLRRALVESLERRELMASVSFSGDRWSIPTGGFSLAEGDPATISWSIVPDATTYDLTIAGIGDSNLVAFMDGIYGTSIGPISSRPWFNLVVEAYDRWSQASGLNFVYEPFDDGLPIGFTNRGLTGVRGDIRLSGRNIDGNGNALAIGFSPIGGGTLGLDGDTIIDTSDLFFQNNAGGDNRGLINALAQQTGIAFGLGIATPTDNTKLMESPVSLAFIGPQHDDILSAQTLYGDNNELPGDPAVDLGLIANGRQTYGQVSIDRNGDRDDYFISTISSGRLTIRVIPIGQQYLVGSTTIAPVPVDTLRHKDLSFQLLDSAGTVLAQVAANGIGLFEELVRFNIPGNGRYRIRVLGTTGESQFYNLELVASGFINNGFGVEPPRLLSVAPNSGQIFDPNVGNVASANVLTEAPRELIFRFSGSQQLDPASLQGIRITRSGGDDNFNSGNEVVIAPSFLGFGENDRIVIARFGETLPDDRYRIEILAVDDNGLPPLQSIDEQILLPRFAGTDRDTFYMNLELGAKIIAVVPQPVVRQANGTLQQNRDKIDVYFNADDLDSTIATRPEFYQLILTKESVTPNDDVVFTPSAVSYDSVADKAVLTFSDNLDILAGGSGTFRLRIGSNRAVASFAAPQVPLVTSFAPDPGDTLASASTVLGTLSSPTSHLIDSTVAITATNRLNLSYPGSNFDPGHRDIQDETHLGGGADASPSITKIFYNFAKDRSYGLGSNSQPLYTSITPDQEQRIREIFEFYSAQAGIDFVESQSDGLTIVVGDLFPLNNPPPPFTPAGIAGGGLAIMNGSLSWNNGLGESFFDVSLHEIGHLLGLGHTYEQPSGTVQGSTGQLNSGNPIEFFFPGNIDIDHLQHMHRPDNRDVDIFKFDLPVGQKGKIVAETIAERLGDASDLDTYLTLFKRDATGLHIIAINDNYFSDDSLIRADITGEAGAEYFIAVTSRGNENYDPKINGSGSGGVSQGRYQLRVDYRPSEVNQILDTSGTPLDGDGDGLAGGEFNFWFRAASPVGVAASGAAKTIFVDKDNIQLGRDGSLGNPYSNIPSALAVAVSGDIVRLVGSAGFDRNVSTTADNIAYEIGDGGPGKGILSDGPELVVPKGVTLMIDAGAIFKLASTEILVGSIDASADRSGAAIQILGTPSQSVIFTSHFDESLGIDTNLLNTQPAKGQWGGVEIRNDVDREQGRRDPELDGIFLNYVGQADIRYGGGTVGQGTQARVVNPIHLTSARPTLLNNRISQSADAGISADPNSFEETLFTESRYQFTGLFTPDYNRVGPDIRSQHITDSSTNGLFIRIDTLAGQKLKTLNVAARLDDTDIVYVLGENLIIEGTPGGAFKETAGPDLTLVATVPTAGGSLAAGQTYNYRMTFIDRYGNEGLPSLLTPTITLTGANTSILLNNLAKAAGDFVGRRLYRKLAASSRWDLVAELDKDSSSYLDNGKIVVSDISIADAAFLQRSRRDASLVVDPGVVIKLQGARIEVGIGAQLTAEGTASKPIIFTGRKDDRYGAGATFDTNNDLAVGVAAAGDWAGIHARHFSSLSIDSALITFGGGSSSISGGFATFNAIEVNQATARIANSILENNARGNATAGTSNRDFHGPTDASVIHVVASQPVIFKNIIRNNDTAAAISIDANSMKAVSVRDYGRATGVNARSNDNTGNLGPFVLGNELGGNAINGLRVRGATLTTEAVWDDTDIVHVLQSQIVVPDFHTFGGLRLQSQVDESLVVKLSGANAGFTASGRPLDIPSRIGGSLQIVGAPGFPVVLTSLSDDSAGAGFDWEGRPMLDTNNDGVSAGRSGDWRSVRLNPYSNDRNLDTTFELESDPVGDKNRNDLPAAAQNIGSLANNLNGGDENVRLGFTIFGTVAALSDLDVYRFTATGGTTVWFDIDRTGAALDSVVELINAAGQIIAQSNHSYNESVAGTVYSNATLLDGGQALPMNQSSFVTSTNDFQSINPLDAGLRIQLPGVAGTTNPYFIRIRSSNLAPSDPTSKLQNLAEVANGLSVGAYRLQIRLQQADEVAGSTIRFADVRYATTGIEVLGLPGHSPLTSESAEDPTGTNDPATAQNLGNIANSDRSGISVAGTLGNATDLDWYRFRVSRDSIQSPGNLPLGTVLDIDYADGLGRPDATLWVYKLDNANVPQLVLIGTDSNIADDRAAPGGGTSSSDLSRGSFGPRDPFIGVQELPDGEYLVAVTPSSRVEQQFRQFSQAAAANPLFRLEPISSAQRIADDHFENSTYPLPAPIVAQQVAFDGNTNAVPLNLSDVTLFVSQTDERTVAGNRSRLLFANPLTGAREAELSQGLNFPLVHGIAVNPAGLVLGAETEPTGVLLNDANTGFITAMRHDGSTQTRANPLIVTTETYSNGAATPVFTVTQARNGAPNNATPGVGTVFTAMSFVDDPQAAATASLALFGIGQRANRQPFDSAVLTLVGNAINLTGLTPGDPNTTAYKNILYRLNPDTRLAISPTNAPDRAGDRRARGTGTDVREYGVFAEISTYFWDRNNNGFGDDIVVTRQANGDIVGLAEVNGFLYGVTDAGELWRMQMGSFTNGFQRGATLVSSAIPFGLTGLAKGPRNVEGGAFANTLFGITSTGQIHAFDTAGLPQPIFPGAATSVVAPTADGLGTVNGIDFAALDVNLWHTTTIRGTAADVGHGRPVNFDLSRFRNQAGNNSLYFGYEPTGGNANVGNWDRIYRAASAIGTYDFAGGAAGAVESNPIDLRGYSVDDKPMLYFTYRAATENSNGPNTDNNPMLDAFRVYGIDLDGTSRLLATNNAADDQNYLNTNNEFDPANPFNDDVFGNPYKPQTLFDALEANDTGGWRQARIPLAAFAGQNGVKLRFEFSTGGTFRSDDPLRGGVELGVVAGSQIEDRDTFTITGPGPLGPTITRNFEFDLGLVLNLPSGGSIVSGNQLIVQGRAFTFVNALAGVRPIVFATTDTPAQIATKVAAALTADGFSVTTNSSSRNILNVNSGSTVITAAGPHSVIGLDSAIIVGGPGVVGTNVAVPITQNMTANVVRDRIRQALATTFNATGQAANLDVWKFYNNTLQLHNYVVEDKGPLTLLTQRPGDLFGPKVPTGGMDPTLFAQASLRANSNLNEGIFVDDIIIGLAERGEMAVNATAAAPVFQPDNILIDGGYPALSPIPSGTYQLEIRTAADYLIASSDPTIEPILGRTFDSNDRLAQQLSLVVNGSGVFTDGATFTLSDGVNQVRFEFDVALARLDRASGVTAGNVAIVVSPDATTGEIAQAIRDAINSTTSQSVLRLRASVVGEMADGAGGYLTPDDSNVIQLHGQAAANLRGSLLTNLTGLTLLRSGTDTAFGEDLGDSNRRRDQGQIVIAANTVRNSATFGIVVDDAVRDQSNLAQFLGDRPYPGSVRNLVTFNNANLAPGVVIANNIVASNTRGGIQISGDNTGNVPRAASNIARVYNNTVYGSLNGDRGIVVEETATATVLNNILANLTTGIALGGSGNTTVLGANIFQSNGTDVTGGGIGTFQIQLTPTDPLFANVTNSRFYLAPLSSAIDSSLSSLPELDLLSQVKNSVGLPVSPLIAPDRDVTGVLRIDDQAVNTPSGQGQNVNIDRGAVERADSVRLKAILINPLDNDSANLDVDRNNTYVRLLNGSLEFFSILLSDEQGSGPDATTILPESVVITENGRQLIESVDYVFGYNSGSNTIRLTPLSGLWRRDSVYEITLINKPTFRIDSGDGTTLTDGDSFTLTLTDGSTRTLEYDSGFVIDVPFALTAAAADGQTITYQSISGSPQTFEFNLVGSSFNPSNTPIDISPSDTFLTIASKLESALAPVVIGGSYPVKHLGQGRVYVGGASGDNLQVSNAFLSVTGLPGVTSSIEIQTPLIGGNGIVDGQIFSIMPAAGLPVIFEFDNNTSTSFGNRVIPFSFLDSPDVLASKIATTIAGAGLGFTPTTKPNGLVKLNEPQGTVLNLLTANLTSTGVAGGAISLPFIPSSSFSALDVSSRTIQTLNQLGQGIKAISVGGGAILIEGIVALTGASTSTLPVIRDIAGNPLDANRSNSLTQFTIVMPEIKLDFGDAPGSDTQTLQANNGARHALLPPDAIQVLLGPTVDNDLDGQPNASATGDDINGTGDDEDGVQIGGYFNVQSPDTSVVITSTGIGFVDAWIDWNRDGDFSDVGEQVITNQVAARGDTTFMLRTPSNASVGLSSIRVRLSTLGNLLSGGVGIGGEVEDHQIEIINNSPPTAVNDLYSVSEDNTLVVSAPGVVGNDTDPNPGAVLSVVDSDLSTTGIQPSVLPSFGTLSLASDGSFSYTPNANFSGTDSFAYLVSDSVLTSLTAASVTITVTPINDAPLFTIPASLDVLEDQGSTIDVNGMQVQVPVSIAGFATAVRKGAVGANDEDTQTLTFQVVAREPSFFDVQPAIVVNSGNPSEATLIFTLAKNRNRDFANGFNNLIEVTLSDDGSNIAPDVNTSTTATFSINITPVNDPPVADNHLSAVDEDSTITISATSVLVGDLGGPADATDELSQTVSMVDIALLSSNGGTIAPVFNGLTVDSFNYTPAPNFVGTDTITYTIFDNAGASPRTSFGTISVTVTGVNDPPVFTIPASINVDEDQGSTFVSGIQVQLPISIAPLATGVSPGPNGSSDEAGQSVTFDVVAIEPSFFQVQPTLAVNPSNLSEAILTFTLAPHRNRDFSNGLNNRVQIIARDNGSSIAPNVNSSAATTFSINIAPINDPPIPGNFNPTVAEDSATTFTAVEVLVNAMRGPSEAIDEASQILTISQISQRSLKGGVVNPFINGNVVTSFRYIPPANFVGTDTITYTVTDSDVNSLSTVGTITINVTAVNDAPEFSVGPDVTVFEDASAYSQQWVPFNSSVPPSPAILAGPVNARDELDGSQTVGFDVTTTNAVLFAQAPAISAAGVLTFTQAKDANGVAIVSVTAIDTGSDGSPNVNRSQTITFTITMSPVNDEPDFTAGSDQSVNEDSGDFNQSWATGVQPAAGLTVIPSTAGDESSQTVSFVFLTNSNPGLFIAGPAIAADGKLSFTPALNQSGVAIVTVVARDSGASISPDDNASEVKTFTINVLPVNDPPIGVSDSYTTTEDAPLISTTNKVSGNDSDPDGNTFEVISGNTTSARGASVLLRSDGSFEYDPLPATSLQALQTGQTLTDTFVYRLQDSTGQQSLPTTVTITVDGRNDSPNAIDDILSVAPDTTTNLNVLANDVDPDSLFNLSSLQLGILPSNGTVAKLANGQLAYTPNAGFRGSDSFTYRISDTTGLISNEATVTVRVNRAPLALADSVTLLSNGSVIIVVLSNDSDPDGNGTINTNSVTIVTLPSDGTAVKQSDGTIRFTPSTGFTGTATFRYTIADTSLAVSDPGLVTVSVVASLYQNPSNRFDVNNDGFVSPIDALIVINDLQRRGTRILSPTEFTPPPFIDVDGSGSVEPIDVLQIINFLNRQSRGGSGEGEDNRSIAMLAPAVTTVSTTTSVDVMMVTPEQMISTVGVRVIQEVRQAIVAAAIESDSTSALDDDESLILSLASSTNNPKRLQQIDDAFVDSRDELWEVF